MTSSDLETALRNISSDLSAIGTRFALVGGLAVSVRTEPRFTRDVDLAVFVETDRDAEALIQSLTLRGYAADTLVEHEARGRLATVRLKPPTHRSLLVDLLFAASGIEREIVADAQPIEVIDGLIVPVATIPHLIAMKMLSIDDRERPQDRVDVVALLAAATHGERSRARAALQTIADRGFDRGKDLLKELRGLDSR
jgi:predicted nucleotidyltransferase